MSKMILGQMICPEMMGGLKMQLEALRKDMVAAMKAKDKERKEAISSLVSAVKKQRSMPDARR